MPVDWAAKDGPSHNNAFRNSYILQGRADRIQKLTRTSPLNVLHLDPASLVRFTGFFFTLGDRTSKRNLEPLAAGQTAKLKKNMLQWQPTAEFQHT